MARPEQHNCLFCGAFFRADPRNAKHQNYCSEPGCRKASKAASRRAWLAKAENQDYFRGPENVARVQAWRAEHPGYWRRPKGQCGRRPNASRALQDIVLYLPAVLIGFIAQFTGSTLQDDIARSSRRLIELGHDILAGRIGDDPQTCALSGAAPTDFGAVQLDRPPTGSRAVHRAL